MINSYNKNLSKLISNPVMVSIFNNNLGEPMTKYEDQYTIVENEANEHEFNAGCLIF